MHSMNITKSAFMEMIRCRRYPALHRLLQRQNLEDDDLDRYYLLMEGLEDLDEDAFEPDLEQLQIMMPYFDQIEVLAARRVMAEWPGETRYGTTYGAQKQFLRDYDSFVLMCNVDIYHKDASQIHIVEVKATTSNKFLNMTYKQDGIEHHVFFLDERGILHLMEERDSSVLADKKYVKQRSKLFDRFSDVGVYVYDLAFQRFVIEEKHPGAKYYLGVLNHEYVFDGTYVDGEPVYDNEIVRFVDLTRITGELQDRIERDIQTVIERIKDDNEAPVPLGVHCQLKKQRQCLYKDVCFQMFPKTNSILQYLDKHHGFKDEGGTKHDVFDLVEEGYLAMTDLPHEWLHRRNNQIQRDVALTHKPYIDHEKIRAGLTTIQYPIYHLDFESFPCPLPRFAGETPYMQSLFQFSLHIEREPGVCDKEADHIEYLSRDHEDNREELVRRLCEAIPADGGSVLVYNQSFEKTRIKELARMFPAYATHLHDINERLFDLMHLIKTNTALYEGLGFDTDRAKSVNYYHEDLVGSYSIKKVLPIFSELTYAGMEVGNGMEAVRAYASYPLLDDASRADVQAALVAYCQQDTWAMVEILDALRKM
jgi:hypothetical protein